MAKLGSPSHLPFVFHHIYMLDDLGNPSAACNGMRLGKIASDPIVLLDRPLVGLC